MDVMDRLVLKVFVALTGLLEKKAELVRLVSQVLMVLMALMVFVVTLDPVVLTVSMDVKVLKDDKVLQVVMVARVHKVLLVMLVPLVLMVSMAVMVAKVSVVIKVLLALLVVTVLMVVRVSVVAMAKMVFLVHVVHQDDKVLKVSKVTVVLQVFQVQLEANVHSQHQISCLSWIHLDPLLNQTTSCKKTSSTALSTNWLFLPLKAELQLKSSLLNQKLLLAFPLIKLPSKPTLTELVTLWLVPLLVLRLTWLVLTFSAPMTHSSVNSAFLLLLL
jgi:hypothetical protein